MVSNSLVHVLLVSFPGQGHVNPLLRLGKRLASKGMLVTFSAPEGFGKQMRKANNITDQPVPVGDGFIRFEFFEDGWEEDDPRRQYLDQFLSQLELAGKQAIPQMIKKHSEQGHPVSCLINNPFFPWVSDVAESLGLPSAVLWIQSCACFSAYYHYSRRLVPFPTEENPEIDVQLPFMPLLKYDEVPSFYILQLLILSWGRQFWASSRILDPKAPTATVRGDFLKADDCIEWLNSKPPSSAVYVSFGSVVSLRQDQLNEIAYGLLNSGVSFLWVFRPPPKDSVFEPVEIPDGLLEKTRDKGKIVQWSPQERVLAHPSVACFMTHCGWNSTMEALSSGMPVVAFPQWGDQVTDAKFLVDVFKLV
ncbi:hypothetical protein GH714_013819 [Hevea brasiliensis]|uniref:anthocyanidin 3-O-glucosyltransferase n=1 Tax=Hevea brasiliensis TaxID=3981 RepID=A0A6A6KZY0_HEVBR|nr:hypothetical protein GH714_013819 [Hevea brasiliensis]